jgi:DNA (cytosine-5)-methyltransferase 1
MTITEAAGLLGVSTSTLRNWDRAGKLKAARNPMNRYRLYRREDVEELLQSLDSAEAVISPRAREG